MAWLQKRPQVSDPAMFYSVGLNKTKLLVGLGNIGKEYESTRHNIGFMCIDDFIKKSDDMDNWIEKKSLKSQISTGTIGDVRVIAIKPSTLMNLSGDAVQAVLSFYKFDASKVLVIHDELDVDFGQIRMRIGGSSAGHNGIKSVSEQIGETYGRVRIGIGPKVPAKIKSEDYVLQSFSPDQNKELPHLIQEVNAIISEYIFGDNLINETRSFLF
jgi:PTH1 family peptidyl-tRNA hydrolase